MSRIIKLSVRVSSEVIENYDNVISSLPFGESEKVRLNSIKNPIYKAESLAALIALGDIVQDLSSDLNVSRTDNNKPYFKNSNLHFSLSHSEGLSVAVLGDTPVGIDIEVLDTNRDIEKTVNRFFNESEKAILQGSADRFITFYSIWTKKEALSKISGEGLSGISNQDSSHCLSHQYILKLQSRSFIMSVCSSTADTVTINNTCKELKVYEL